MKNFSCTSLSYTNGQDSYGSLGGSVSYLYWLEYSFRYTGSSSFAILRICTSSKEGTGVPCPFLIDECKNVMSLRFDQGLQIDFQGAQHLGEFRIVVG